MKKPIAQPPKNLNEPPITTHLQVGFINISEADLRNFLKGFTGAALDLGLAVGDTDYFTTSNLPLVGSKTKINMRTPEPMPTNPIIAKVHLQPTPDIIKIVRDDRAPPIYIPKVYIELANPLQSVGK